MIGGGVEGGVWWWFGGCGGGLTTLTGPDHYGVRPDLYNKTPITTLRRRKGLARNNDIVMTAVQFEFDSHSTSIVDTATHITTK